MQSTLGHKAASGALWATIDRFGSMGIAFIVNLVLARLLMPEDFGIIGMIAIFIAVSQTLIDGGFSSALIQKKEPTQSDYSTIFYWNTAFALFLYALLFVSAPFIAKFYRNALLTDVLRALGLSLIFVSISAVQVTRLKKMLAFKTIAITNLSAYTVSGLVSVFLAYRGWGVWSLVVMQLLAGVSSVAVLGLITRWLPSPVFSRKSFKELFSFGGYILAANVLQTTCQNFQGVIIGRKFSAIQMGYYSQAYKLDQVTSYSVPQVIVQVMYPVYSSIQEDRQRLQNVILMNVRVICFLIFPLLGLLMIAAEPLMVGLYGTKWLPAAPYFKVLCVGGLFVCLQNINFYAVAAVGKSRELFLWSLYKWGFLLTGLFVGSLFGMYGILWAMVASSLNIYAVNAALVSKHVGLRLTEQIKVLAPILFVWAISLLCSYGIGFFMGHKVFCELIVFIVAYGILTPLFNKKAVGEAFVIIKNIIKR